MEPPILSRRHPYLSSTLFSSSPTFAEMIHSTPDPKPLSPSFLDSRRTRGGTDMDAAIRRWHTFETITRCPLFCSLIQRISTLRSSTFLHPQTLSASRVLRRTRGRIDVNVASNWRPIFSGPAMGFTRLSRVVSGTAGSDGWAGGGEGKEREGWSE